MPTPAVVAHCSSKMMQEGGRSTSLWCVLLTEWLVLVFAILIDDAYARGRIWWPQHCLLTELRKIDSQKFVSGSEYFADQVQHILDGIRDHPDRDAWKISLEHVSVLGSYLRFDRTTHRVVDRNTQTINVVPDTIIPKRFLGSADVIRRFSSITGCTQIFVAHTASFLDGVLNPDKDLSTSNTSITEVEARLRAAQARSRVLEEEVRLLKASS